MIGKKDLHVWKCHLQLDPAYWDQYNDNRTAVIYLITDEPEKPIFHLGDTITGWGSSLDSGDVVANELYIYDAGAWRRIGRGAATVGSADSINIGPIESSRVQRGGQDPTAKSPQPRPTGSGTRSTVEPPVRPSPIPSAGSEKKAKPPLRLDAAVPEEVIFAEPFDLAVAVRQAESPPLQVDELVRVRSAELEVEWPADESPVVLRVHVDAPFCRLHGANYRMVRLRAGQDSPIVYFTLTPERVGEIKIRVTVSQLLVSLGSARIPVRVHEQMAGAAETMVTSVVVGKPTTNPDSILLYRLINGAFSWEELQALYFEMGIDFDEVAGATKSQKASGLIIHCEHRGRAEDLIDHVFAARPNWMELIGEG
jgi:hypothetical protein